MGGTVLDFGVCVRIFGKGVCFFVLKGWDFGCFGVLVLLVGRRGGKCLSCEKGSKSL